MKSIFKSKTFWFNLGGLVFTAALPEIQAAIAAHPVVAAGIVKGANIALRLVTTQPVAVLPSSGGGQ